MGVEIMSYDNNGDFLDNDIIDNDDFVSEEEFFDYGELDLSDVETDEFDNDTEHRFSGFLTNSKVFDGAMISIMAVLSLLLIYMNCFMYSPKEHDINNNNLFSGNSIVLSDDELNRIVENLEQELGVDINSENIDNYLLLNAVLENECLTEKEKDVFYTFIDMIKDNPYIDKEQAYHSLLNVDVARKCRPFGYDKTIQGVYIDDLNSIGIFEDDENNLILKHEGIHCIFSYANNLPEYFREGMTELLTNEYFSESPFLELSNYPFEIVAVKILCGVTSPEIVLEAFSKGDMNIIIEDMTKITKNYDDSKTAVDMLEKVILKLKGEIEDDLSYQDILNSSIPIFRGIVSAKYPEGDLDREAYFYNELLLASVLKENPYDEYINTLLELGTMPKVYFSSKLIEKTAQQMSASVTGDSGEKVLGKKTVK